MADIEQVPFLKTMFSSEDSIEKIKSTLVAALSKKDKEEQDILHMIELSGWVEDPRRTIKEISRIRRKRREIKDMISLTQSAMDKLKNERRKNTSFI
jgi:uncharacterized protein YjhX (UPF0386 family)